MRRLAGMLIQLKQIISYADQSPEKRRKYGKVRTSVSHPLLQGDFFLTSRCNPPDRRRVQNMSSTQHDDVEALASRTQSDRSEKSFKEETQDFL